MRKYSILSHKKAYWSTQEIFMIEHDICNMYIPEKHSNSSRIDGALHVYYFMLEDGNGVRYKQDVIYRTVSCKHHNMALYISTSNLMNDYRRLV